MERQFYLERDRVGDCRNWASVGETTAVVHLEYRDASKAILHGVTVNSVTFDWLVPYLGIR
jgi:hypothetical protein